MSGTQTRLSAPGYAAASVIRRQGGWANPRAFLMSLTMASDEDQAVVKFALGPQVEEQSISTAGGFLGWLELNYPVHLDPRSWRPAYRR